MPHTPGLAIGLATPMGPPPSAGRNSQQNPHLTPTTEEGSQLERTTTQRSSKQEGDYFGTVTSGTNGNANGNGKPEATAEGSSDGKEEGVSSPTEPDTPAKKGKGMFGKKFNMSFNMKKFSTGIPIAEPAKPAAVDEKAEDSDSRSSKTDEKNFEDNFFGGIQRIRQGYEEQLAAGVEKIESQITPSLPNETPVLKPPSSTTILIQEDRPDSGGVADLFEGKVGSLGQQADLIEKAAPLWLSEVLLRVRILISCLHIHVDIEAYTNTTDLRTNCRPRTLSKCPSYSSRSRTRSRASHPTGTSPFSYPSNKQHALIRNSATTVLTRIACCAPARFLAMSLSASSNSRARRSSRKWRMMASRE